MSWPKVLAVAAACSVLPVRAVALGVRQVLPDREGIVRTSAIPFPGQPTVTVTTRLSVTITTGTGAGTGTGTGTDTAPPTAQPTNTGDLPTDITDLSPGVTPPGSGPGSGTATETLLTDMPTISGPSPTDTDSSGGTGSSGGSSGGVIGSNRALVIALSTVLSVVGLLLILGVIFICRRKRKGRFPFFPRGASPIDDDEIATWKVPRSEKGPLPDSGAGGGAAALATAGAVGTAGATVAMVGAAGGRHSDSGGSGGDSRAVSSDSRSNNGSGNGNGGSPSHVKNASTSSIKKPPSVIVYSNAHQGIGGYRHSSDNSSPRSFGSYDASTGPATGLSGKTSFDKVLPQTPIQAKAPNARAGLTDESIPGDDPFIANPRRQPSRLSKLPPGFSSAQRRAHVRTRSSRSSFRSFNEYAFSGSEQDLPTGRHSHDYVPRSHNNSNWKVYSSSSIPPRLSFSDDSFLGGSLSPRPLLGRQEYEIGRAIG
ncbi:hypothetical protein B0T16DRAFT_451925 [Cercophora newfieldiana]|uniref:Uncharacterized protein n=1 Tax=Cercophora newfieldiana TaxID=92897 RepID=A0AA39YRZ9_9PEZI|nr:hypothetical protein B0T16DRAFT_451925 [Cercophora newfieldiana]